MRIVWTPAAANDLEQISDFLFEQSASTGVRLVRQIYSAASTLEQFPNKGRPGKKEGKRELVLPGLPWIIIYEAEKQTVRIIRILHGAQRPALALRWAAARATVAVKRVIAWQLAEKRWKSGSLEPRQRLKSKVV